MKKAILFLVIAVVLESTYGKFPRFKDHQEEIYTPDVDVGQPLILTPYLEKNQIQDAREAAEVHLDAFKDVVSYSGYFNVDKENNGSLFFWFFPSADNYTNDPVVLWLQGGPGSSSLYGLFDENGPFIVEEDGNVTLREYSWHKNQSVIYIDQPVGTGFSFSESFVTNQTEVGAHLYDALTQFFTLFPELQTNDFFVSGESYAGKYIPAIGYTIFENNPTAELKINLQGLLIGNGLSDPINQVSYGDLLYQLGLTDKNGLENYHNQEQQLIEYIKNEDFSSAINAFNNIFDYYENNTELFNVYNYLKDELDDSDAYARFLNTAEVRQALHVGNQQYSSLSYDVYDGLMNDMMKSVAPWVSTLLSNYRVLIFNGQLDVIVNYILTANYLQKLDFSSAKEYKNATRKVWHVNNKTAGYSKVAGNLTEVLVRNAGHMVPAEQPEAAYQLLYRFIRGLSLE